jgi:hypothetical protein
MRALVSVSALAVCLVVPAGLVDGDYLRTVLWGGAILVSAVGWGAIVARRLYGDDARVGWGLEAALGLAVHLALGGLLAVFSLVSLTTCCVAVALGVALFALQAWRRAAATAAPPDSDSPKGTRPGDIVGVTVIILVLGVAVIYYLAMAQDLPGNGGDDYPAYWVFPKQLLATGTLFEPFSSRRIYAYGGQSYLQALVLAFSTVSRIGVFDNGICVLVLAGLVIGWVRERPRLSLAVVVPALLGLIALRYQPHNAASEFSGAVFFLAIFRVLDRPRRAGETAWANALALALVACAVCTLRGSNLAAAALIPAFYYGIRMAREGDARRRWAQEAVLVAVFSLVLLLPWMVLAYRSCGTPLYPLILGNGSKDFVSFEPPITAAGKARFFIAASFYPGRLPGLPLAFLAGLLVPSRASLALRASLAGTALATVILFNALASADHIDSTDRYLFPFGLGYFLAVSLVAAGAVADPATRRTRRSMTAMALVVAVLVLQLALPPKAGYAYRQAYLPPLLFQMPKMIPANAIPSHLGPPDAPYAALQRAVPEHATLLVLLDQPFRLDFKRNRIFLWDQPGTVSPPPDVPIGQGPQALARYLLDQGIRYVADSSHYNDAWENLIRGPAPPRDGTRGGPAIRKMGQLWMDVAFNLQKLNATRKLLYAENGVYVLDLATPASAPP